MSPTTYQAIQTSGALIDLSDRAKFLLTGEDRVRYLNGQVTHDVRKANGTHALHACVTNLKGRIEGDLRIHASQTGEPGLWLDAEPGLREPLAIRLERYIIADDAELLDVSDDWQLFHLMGSAAEPFLAQVGIGGVLHSQRFGVPGIDLWLPKDQPAPIVSPDCPHLTSEETNQLRLLKGIPRWPEELNTEAFPQEAGLEKTAMDFYKGCYIGQEILSRIKTSGKTPRHLVTVTIAVPASGLSLPATPTDWTLEEASGDSAGRSVGVITSIAQHPVLDLFIGLAYVRHVPETSHSLLLVTGPTSKIKIPIQVEPLPPQ